jgi:hypothetical protein
MTYTVAFFVFIFASSAMGQAQGLKTWATRLSTDPALTGEQRLQLMLKTNFLSAGALARTAFPAAITHLNDSPPEWDRNGEGFSRRLGFQFATQTSRGLIRSGGAALLGTDPRYQRCECKGIWRRSGHALSALVLAADSNGVRRWDPSNLLSAYGSGYIGATLYPDRYSVAVKGYQLGNQQVLQIGMQNVLLEFGPDIGRFVKKKIFRR